jgi:hypothetical protein
VVAQSANDGILNGQHGVRFLVRAFPFNTTSRTALGSTQSPIRGLFPWEWCQTELEADHSPPSSTIAKNERSLASRPLSVVLKHWDVFSESWILDWWSDSAAWCYVTHGPRMLGGPVFTLLFKTLNNKFATVHIPRFSLSESDLTHGSYLFPVKEWNSASVSFWRLSVCQTNLRREEVCSMPPIQSTFVGWWISSSPLKQWFADPLGCTKYFRGFAKKKYNFGFFMCPYFKANLKWMLWVGGCASFLCFSYPK